MGHIEHLTGILKEWDGKRGVIVTDPDGYRVHFYGGAAKWFGIAGPIFEGMRIDFLGECALDVGITEVIAYEHKSGTRTSMRRSDHFKALGIKPRRSTRGTASRQRSKPGRPRP